MSYVTKPVPLIKMQKEKLVSIKAYESDLEKLQELQKLWSMRTQQEAVSKLVMSGEEVINLQRNLLEAQNRISQLEQQLQQRQAMPQTEGKELVDSQPNQLVARVEHLENLVTALLKKLEDGQFPLTTQGITKSQPPQPKEEEKDWQSVPSEELRKMKARPAVEEKLKRVFQAIANYNDNVASSNDERWYIGNVTLRELSGANGQVIADWINRHQTLVSDHNNKYSLGQYHNKRHKGKLISDVISW